MIGEFEYEVNDIVTIITSDNVHHNLAVSSSNLIEFNSKELKEYEGQDCRVIQVARKGRVVFSGC